VTVYFLAEPARADGSTDPERVEVLDYSCSDGVVG
jgi:hypothetical protein